MPSTRSSLTLFVTLVALSAAAVPARSDSIQRKVGPDNAYAAPTGSKLKRRRAEGTSQRSIRPSAPARDDAPWHRMDCETC